MFDDIIKQKNDLVTPYIPLVIHNYPIKPGVYVREIDVCEMDESEVKFIKDYENWINEYQKLFKKRMVKCLTI